MKTQQMSDEEVMLGCLQGNRQEWKEFWVRFGGIVYSFPKNMLGFSEDDARNFYLFFQEQLYDGLVVSSYSQDIPFQTWLYSIIKSCFAKFLRHSGTSFLSNIQDKSAPNFSLLAELRGFSEKNTGDFPNCSRLLEIERAFLDLKPLEKLLLKLNLCVYFYLTPEDLALIQEKSSLELPEIIQSLKTIRRNLAGDKQKRTHTDKSAFNAYLNTIHLERRLFSLYKQIEDHEAEHNFDFRLMENIETQRKKLLKQIEKVASGFANTDYAEELAIPSDDACAGFCGLKSGRMFAQKLSSAAAAFSKKLTNTENDPSIQKLWLRFLAIEEKIGMISHARTADCPPHKAIGEYLDQLDNPSSGTAKISRHILRCPHCAALIQFIMECRSEYDSAAERPSLPKEMLKHTIKTFKKKPLHTPAVTLSLGRETLRLEKSNLDTSMDGFAGWYTNYFAPLRDTDKIAFFHRSNNLLFRFVCEKNGKLFQLQASGVSAEKEIFPGTFVLVDENGNILPQKFNSDGVSFVALPAGFYSLSILKNSKSGVIEIESVKISVSKD